MREIKFRAWCEKIQHYFYDVAIYPNGVVARKSNALLDILTEGETHWHELDNAVIEQYTGFKDKNGKEIYEGDIIREKGFLSLTCVEWDKNNAHYMAKVLDTSNCVSTCFYFDIIDALECEVIGNIHENPELLGK